MAVKKTTKKPSRTRASSSTTSSTKTPVKKSVASKGSGRSTSRSTSVKKTSAPKKTSTARRPANKKTAAKKTTAKKTAGRNVKKVTKPASKRGGATREMDPVTGFAVGTDSQIIAEALMEGGTTRQEIIDNLKETLDGETRNGTDKPVANLVAGVHNKLIARGFEVEGSFRLVPPTNVKGSRKRR